MKGNYYLIDFTDFDTLVSRMMHFEFSLFTLIVTGIFTVMCA